ncbi:phosphotransferase [Bacillus licheniformis]|nr:phosphotransferase [Bacillus licheniformis]
MMESALSLADDLKCSGRRLALCHTDVHGWNLMKTGGELILIDWEGLKLAPVEADLMFFANQPYAQEFCAFTARLIKDLKSIRTLCGLSDQAKTGGHMGVYRAAGV